MNFLVYKRAAGTHTEPPHLMQHVDVVSALRLLVQQNNFKELRISWTLLFSLFCFIVSTGCNQSNNKRAYADNSIEAYFSERTCWWNEVCKREFQVKFRCRCPRWSFCRSPGRYFDAYCTITRTGYIWLQHSVDTDD